MGIPLSESELKHKQSRTIQIDKKSTLVVEDRAQKGENTKLQIESPYFGDSDSKRGRSQFPKNSQGAEPEEKKQVLDIEDPKKQKREITQVTQGSMANPTNQLPHQPQENQVELLSHSRESPYNSKSPRLNQPDKKGKYDAKSTSDKERYKHLNSVHIPSNGTKDFFSDSSKSSDLSKDVSDLSSKKKTPTSAMDSSGKQQVDKIEDQKEIQRSKSQTRKKIKHAMTNKAMLGPKISRAEFQRKKRLSVYYARRPSGIAKQIEEESKEMISAEKPEIPRYVIPTTSQVKSPVNPLSPRRKGREKDQDPKDENQIELSPFNKLDTSDKDKKGENSNHDKTKDRRMSEQTIQSVRKLSIIQRRSITESQKENEISRLQDTTNDEKEKSEKTDSQAQSIEHQIEMRLENSDKSQTSQEMSIPLEKEGKDLISFEDTSINQLIHSNRESGNFADLWSKLILISITFNFITAWYFLGQEGFPEGAWLTAELIVEMVILFDFILRYYLMQKMPNQWKTMWLLQPKEKSGGSIEWFCYFLASIPQSFIFSLIFKNKPNALNAFPIAALRQLKLLRFPQIQKYFETKEIERQTHKNKITGSRTIQVVFFFLLATHMIGCIWLVIGRIDSNRNNWFVMARYYGESSENNVRPVTEFEKYVDAVFYTVATMTGLGYGNIVPSTNLEYFVDIFIMITGSSIYAGFFADFAVEIYNQNKKTIENEQKLEQAKRFAIQRNLPDEIRERIRMYYNNLRLNFQLLNDKYSILHQLPLTLRSELSLFFNCELIQKVKFFQLADPAFILAMSRSLTPQICLQHDFVVEVDQVAAKMYFIQHGIVQILATDNKTVIAFQSQGCYFGEIGILLTNKRSCSVQAVSKCSFMTITKEEIEKIFEIYPGQGKFLRAIGRQRLQTTKPSDLDGYEENVFEVGNGENIKIQDSVFNNQTQSDYQQSQEKKTPSIFVNGQSEGSKDMIQEVDSFPSFMAGKESSLSSPQIHTKAKDKGSQNQLYKLHRIDDFSKPTSHAGSVKSSADPIESWQNYQNQNCMKALIQWVRQHILKKSDIPSWRLTAEYADLKVFVIIPFSKLYNIWTSIVVISFLYFIFMVPYQLALDYDILAESGWIYFIPDIIFSSAFCIDILIRQRIAFVVNEHGESNIQTSTDLIQDYYINNLLLWDILAAIPLDYILLPFNFDNRLLRALRVLRFFKLRMFFQFITIMRKHSNVSKALITFSLFFLLFIVIAHFMATTYIFIGKREVGYTRRFDGQTMFSDITARVFITPVEEIEDRDFYYLPPTNEMSKFELYIQFIYLSSCTMGAVMYGDIIPFAMSEQLFDFIAMFTCRIFLAFLFAEAASYLSSVHNSQSQHTMRVNSMMIWCDQNQFPEQLKRRIRKLYDTLWRNFKGVRQQTILKDLPESLQQDVRSLIFKNIIEKWDIFLDQESDKGAVSSIISQLELRIIPSEEYIIRQGETAQHMYFIIKGIVNIISAEGIHLAQISDGKNFGEMALLKEGCVRSASVQAETDVSIAIMSTRDFHKICDLYPRFKQIIVDVAENRAKENKTTIRAIIQEHKRLKKNLHLSISITQHDLTDDFEEDLNIYKGKNTEEEQKETKVSHIDGFKFSLKDISQQRAVTEGIQTGRSGQDSSSQRLGTTIGDDKSSRALLPTEHNESALGKQDIGTDMKYKKKRDGPAEFTENDTSSEQQYSDKDPVSNKRGGTQLNLKKRKFSRVSLKTGAIQDHFQIQTPPKKQEKVVKECLRRSCSMRDFMKYSILIISVYNLIFTPLQFAYRIDYKGIYLMMELFTVVLYVFDIYYRRRNLIYLTLAGGNIPDSTNEIEQTLMDDKDQFLKRLTLIKVEIACSAAAAIPFGFFFQIFEYHEPQMLTITLCVLRLVKILPFLKMFDSLKTRNMKKYRVIEVIVLYYIICHTITCIWISIANFEPDARETWIRRIPVPQEKGMRETADKSDISTLSLYIHSLYFVVNTVSHVAIGDITAVNNIERVFVAILILFGTFIYSFLYGNIVSIVSEFAPNQEITYIEKYKYVMQRLVNLANNDRLMNSVREYFDFIWANDLETYEAKLMSDLPQSIKSDIMLCKFQECIESSLIFKDDQGAIDVSLTNSIISMFKVRVYLSDEYVFRLGSKGSGTYFVIEGKSVLVGACDPQLFSTKKNMYEESTSELEILGFMHAGAHYGNDLPEENHNYNNTRICHMIARKPTVIGIISIEDIHILYKSFPSWKQKIQGLNLFTHRRCEQVFDKFDAEIKHIMAIKRPNHNIDLMPNAEIRLLFLENHFTYTCDKEYSRILLQLKIYEKRNFLDHNNLVIKQKMYFYGQRGKVFPIFDNQYAEALKEKSHQTLISQVYEGVDPSMNQSQQISSQEDCSKLIQWLYSVFSGFYFHQNSKKRKIFDIIQIFNLMYIAVLTPLIIGFKIPLFISYDIVEVVSLVFSIVYILINFRTQVLVKGQSTLRFTTVYKHYQHNGLMLDICGILPFNLIFGTTNPTHPFFQILRALLRAVRIISSWRALFLFRKAEATFKNNRFNGFIQILKAILFISFLGHFMACTFFFIVSTAGDVDTWIDYNGLRTESTAVCYLRSIYTVFNIVCSVGYGDMFPMTDTERVLFTLMITTGDMLFALAFGLITKITLQIALTDETKQFKEKMYNIQEFMKQFNLDQAQQRRVEQYFAYEYQQKYNSNLLSYSDLKGYLPWNLRQRAKYRVSNKLLYGLFSEYESENFVRKLSIMLTAAIFLPGDYIMYKGELGDEMYFMAEGTAFVLLEDKQTVVQTLTRGDHFGEMALLIVTKRSSYVQAESFCIVNILKKVDFDEVVDDFPDILESIKEKKSFSMQYFSNIDGSQSYKEEEEEEILSKKEFRRFSDEKPSKKKGEQKIHMTKKRGLIASNDIIQEERSSQFNSSSPKSSSSSSSKETENEPEKSSSSSHESQPFRKKTKEITIQEPSEEGKQADEADVVSEEVDEQQQQQSTIMAQGTNIQGNYNIVKDRNQDPKRSSSARQSGEQNNNMSDDKGKQKKAIESEKVKNLLEDFDIGEISDSISEKEEAKEANAALDKTQSPRSAKDVQLIDASKDQGFSEYVKKVDKPIRKSVKSPSQFLRRGVSQVSETNSQKDMDTHKDLRRFSILNKNDSDDSLNQFFSSASDGSPDREKELGFSSPQRKVIRKTSIRGIKRPSTIESKKAKKEKERRRKTVLVNTHIGSDKDMLKRLSKNTQHSHKTSRESMKFSMSSNPNLLNLQNQIQSGSIKQEQQQNSAMFNNIDRQLSMQSSSQGNKIKQKTTITSSPALTTIFKKSAANGKGEEYINYTIRRTINQNLQLSDSKKRPQSVEKKSRKTLEEKPLKPVRRLSRISLGKNLILSQTAGLKLQWTVGA